MTFRNTKQSQHLHTCHESMIYEPQTPNQHHSAMKMHDTIKKFLLDNFGGETMLIIQMIIKKSTRTC